MKTLKTSMLAIAVISFANVSSAQLGLGLSGTTQAAARVTLNTATAGQSVAKATQLTRSKVSSAKTKLAEAKKNVSSRGKAAAGKTVALTDQLVNNVNSESTINISASSSNSTSANTSALSNSAGGQVDANINVNGDAVNVVESEISDSKLLAKEKTEAAAKKAGRVKEKAANRSKKAIKESRKAAKKLKPVVNNETSAEVKSQTSATGSVNH